MNHSKNNDIMDNNKIIKQQQMERKNSSYAVELHKLFWVLADQTKLNPTSQRVKRDYPLARNTSQSIPPSSKVVLLVAWGAGQQFQSIALGIKEPCFFTDT